MKGHDQRVTLALGPHLPQPREGLPTETANLVDLGVLGGGKAKGDGKRNTSDRRRRVGAAFSGSCHSPRTDPQRKCSCPPCSTTPTAAGPFYLLPSQRQKTLSSGRRSASPLQGQQGPPQTHFRTMIRHHRLL